VSPSDGDLILKLDRGRGAALPPDVAEVIDGTHTIAGTNEMSVPPPGFSSRRLRNVRARAVIDREWLERLLRGATPITELRNLHGREELPLLPARIHNGRLRQRKKGPCLRPISEGGAIQPSAVAYYVGATLICAWCELRSDVRHFRTDRAVSADVPDESSQSLRR
jgi:hypothetical protein